jgi:hypothetical protein
MKIKSETQNGGSVEFNKAHRAWASYSVAGVSGLPIAPIMYAGVGLPDGRSVQFFLNRDTGLVVIDVVNKNGKGGNEIFRHKV